MESHFKICLECNNFLNEIYQFVAKTKLIDAMFMEIEKVDYQQQTEAPQIQEIVTDSQLQSLCGEQAIELPTDFKEQVQENHLNNVRHKYGLKPLELSAETLCNLFDESKIASALEVKLESDNGEFEINDALSDDQEFVESSEEEDDSEIEQLSDSQLRRHEELHPRDDSSESEPNERKKSKKYRKSDDEKLFE